MQAIIRGMRHAIVITQLTRDHEFYTGLNFMLEAFMLS
jgi:hypothetical protein